MKRSEALTCPKNAVVIKNLMNYCYFCKKNCGKEREKRNKEDIELHKLKNVSI